MIQSLASFVIPLVANLVLLAAFPVESGFLGKTDYTDG